MLPTPMVRRSLSVQPREESGDVYQPPKEKQFALNPTRRHLPVPKPVKMSWSEDGVQKPPRKKNRNENKRKNAQ